MLKSKKALFSSIMSVKPVYKQNMTVLRRTSAWATAVLQSAVPVFAVCRHEAEGVCWGTRNTGAFT